MATEESGNMQQMRKDAIRRTQEMYQRAKAPPGYSGSAFAKKGPPPPPAPKPPVAAQPKPPVAAQPKPPAATQPKPPAATQPKADKAPQPPSFFQALFADGERNLILSILLLLMQEEHSDPSLLFALLYLLL
ncbi:hypothetical protein [Caproicibacterium lactatifermentans]|uniref:Uncharacterized protein n=1 Tax=Caproicibacterium lactatifermentans TaxID=2666138 RepID=A0ABX6PVW7_9FIRM|nr:hypothetical protein [Caproicibacterium lactatifermentans]QKO30176.1 hypothetical protein GKP14_03590 [Caproicibacterium lactatifermentans]